MTNEKLITFDQQIAFLERILRVRRSLVEKLERGAPGARSLIQPEALWQVEVFESIAATLRLVADGKDAASARITEREQCCRDVCDLCDERAVSRRAGTWLHRNPSNGFYDEACLAAGIRERHYRQCEEMANEG